MEGFFFFLSYVIKGTMHVKANCPVNSCPQNSFKESLGAVDSLAWKQGFSYPHTSLQNLTEAQCLKSMKVLMILQSQGWQTMACGSNASSTA